MIALSLMDSMEESSRVPLTFHVHFFRPHHDLPFLRRSQTTQLYAFLRDIPRKKTTPPKFGDLGGSF